MRKKLQRFEENQTLERLIEPGKDFLDTAKGNWKKDLFKNDGSITLEVGCGRGEYAIELAKRYPDRNFIGIDFQGERLWYGAKQVEELGLTNVVFLRMRLEQIDQFFAEDEVDEIWITFPGPRMKKTQSNRRLTNIKFLDLYKSITSLNGIIHLKTDSDFVFDYTKDILLDRKDIKIMSEIGDVYAEASDPQLIGIQTYYEKGFIAEGKRIKYLSWRYI
jgi:tRNA (guanine-N7-)-methyltransferase